MNENAKARVAIEEFNEYVSVEKELIEITLSTAGAIGDQFFLALAKAAQRVMQVSYLLVGRVVVNHGDECVQTLVLQGEKQIPNFTYSLRGAPCRHVVDQKIYYHPRNVQPAYPEDGLLVELGIESYLGYPMIDIDGKTLGLIAVMDTHEMSEAKRAYILSVLWVLASRGAAEIHHAMREANLEELIQMRTDELVSAQMKLAEQDKMVALGKMVAGFSHELNTPIGVAVTASTALNSIAESVKADLGGKQVSRSELLAKSDRLIEASRLVENNLGRAAELITNFKKVSVNLSEDRAEINLAEVLDALIKAHGLTLRNAKLTVECQIDPTITVVASTGAVGQIMSNLFSNTVIHGYPNGGQGNIKINAERLEKMAVISYQDDGIGVDSEVAKYIYEPFFTTKRARGGTGLGMYIVYNIVTKLEGKLAIDLNTAKGFKIDIQLPLKI